MSEPVFTMTADEIRMRIADIRKRQSPDDKDSMDVGIIEQAAHQSECLAAAAAAFIRVAKIEDECGDRCVPCLESIREIATDFQWIHCETCNVDDWMIEHWDRGHAVSAAQRKGGEE